MSLLISSRDIGNKFTFGHWMMRPKDSRLPFKGPGYGRINYWMVSEDNDDNIGMPLKRLEKDFKQMKELGLHAYTLELTGLMEIGDKCWRCCKDDEPAKIEWTEPSGKSVAKKNDKKEKTDKEPQLQSRGWLSNAWNEFNGWISDNILPWQTLIDWGNGLETSDDGDALPMDDLGGEGGIGKGEYGYDCNIDWDSAKTKYFEDEWYDEFTKKYKQVIKLCRKYNIWLLNLTFDGGYWKRKQELRERINGWINKYGTTSPDEPCSAAGDGTHDNLSRLEELKMAISHASKILLPDDKPSQADITKILDIVLSLGGKERIVMCPINAPTGDITMDCNKGLSTSSKSVILNRDSGPKTYSGKTIESEYLKKIKSKGFTPCNYSDNPTLGNRKYDDAKYYQGGVGKTVSSVECEKGFGVTSKEELICYIYDSEQDYQGDHTSDHRNEHIGTTTKANVSEVKTAIKRYKQTNSRAGLIYGWKYNGTEPETETLKAIVEAWNNSNVDDGDIEDHSSTDPSNGSF